MGKVKVSQLQPEQLSLINLNLDILQCPAGYDYSNDWHEKSEIIPTGRLIQNDLVEVKCTTCGLVWLVENN